MIHLTRRDPSKNMARFYALDVHPDLFGAWLLTAEWGRIGQSGTVRKHVFPDQTMAAAMLRATEYRKRRKGYV